ncbi:uncharacterized lipoprotein YddW (UPF0748 family) [Pseudoduganella lurida]|uniref:Uncharacterized lipoprotein YddW (UPF0748 family) n=1 Tax=Pseudoduganella lurida TaxID=1036180 RepID=A0A562QYC8_9BURK|nr:uncharacterized lipoprotein YddW (UPF0748 family) [Pseudoduganella lurida]
MSFDRNKRLMLSAGAAGALAALMAACSTTPTRPVRPAGTPAAGPVPHPEPPRYTGEQPPAAPREFRAAWVSTVANIDWPSRSNLPPAKQQAEAIAILDRAKALNLNAIVLQVRSAADAIYPSQLEPWSEYLTGKQGREPQPAWDPLQFWIAQAHARGMELHAWFNPYRARMNTNRATLSKDHIANTNPQAVKTYGKFLWMDPGEESASAHTLGVILDVVRRYDIDGVHIDDYFYPYPIEAPNASGGETAALDTPAWQKPELPFPDQPSWQRYVAGGGTLDRAAWRRQNVDRLIEQIYLGIRREKSWVKFGISPFGIGRPDRRPRGIAGFSQYDKLYADAELWLQKGWLDYLAPQLYWPIAQAPQAYPVLLDYWLAQNTRGRHIFPGLFTSRVADGSAKPFGNDEIVQQIDVTRTRPAAQGHVHFSMVALMQNRGGLYDKLRTQNYQSAALVPASPWLGDTAPEAPVVAVKRGDRALNVALGTSKNAVSYAIWARYGDEWRFTVSPATKNEIVLADVGGLPARAVVVTAVDRLGNESARASAKL